MFSTKSAVFSDSITGVCLCTYPGQTSLYTSHTGQPEPCHNCVSMVIMWLFRVLFLLSFVGWSPSSHLICLESKDFLPLSCLEHGWNESTDNSDVTLSVCDGLLLTALTWCRNCVSASLWFLLEASKINATSIVCFNSALLFSLNPRKTNLSLWSHAYLQTVF